MTALSVCFDWEKLVDFSTAGSELITSSEVAEALAGFLEPSDSPLFPIDDIFNAASDNVFDNAPNDNFFAAVADSVFADDSLVSSRSPPDHCSLHCCAKRQRCCYSGEPQQSLCFASDSAPTEPQQSLCFAAESAPAEPQQSLCFASDFGPGEPQQSLCFESDFGQSLCFPAEFAPAEPQQSLCFPAEFAPAEPQQSLSFSAEFASAEPPEPHYFRPTPLAEHPEPLPQYLEQTPFSAEFAFNPPPKTAAGCGLSVQSAAARERRKRISDKTQELSRLIPGGGKMNTSEMLQAAHKYVRYLQAQISILGLDKCDKEKSGEEEELLGLLISSAAIQEKLSKQGMCLVPKLMAEEFVADPLLKFNPFMEREINKFCELINSVN